MINLKILNNFNGEYFIIEIDRYQLELYELSNILDKKIPKTDKIFYLLLNGEKIYTNIHKIKPYDKLITFIVDSNNLCELNIMYTSFLHNNEDYYYKLENTKSNAIRNNIYKILVADNSDLLDDENFIIYDSNLFEAYFNLFEYASNRLKYDKNFILLLSYYNNYICKYIPKDLLLDKNYLFELLKNINLLYIYECIHSSYKLDKLFIFKIINNNRSRQHPVYKCNIHIEVFCTLAEPHNPKIIVCEDFVLANQETDNYNFILNLITKYPDIYRILNRDLKSMYAFALCAVQHNGLLLKNVPKQFKENKQLVLEAIKQNSNALKYANYFINDYEIVSFAIDRDINAMQYASRNFKQKYLANKNK